MKTFLPLVALVIALGATASAAAAPAPKNIPAAAHPVKAVAHRGVVVVVPGTTAYDVTTALGAPNRKLGSDVWIYDRYHGGHEQAADDDCSILLLTFQDERVVTIQLVNAKAERVYAARIAGSQNPPALVATTR